MADGLAKAHQAGIVHRDLKPENVMITKDGAVKILDFGLAKLLKPQQEETSNLPTAQATQVGTVLGTIGYMSPEQASGKQLDFRSDQFALGSMFYEMATGKRAFQRGTTAETLTAIIREETEPVAQLNAGVPAPFRWIVERCMQKDPEERYASTRDLARDVRGIREHLSEASVSVSGEVSGARPAVAAPKRSLLRPLLAVLAVLAALGAGMLLQKRLVKTLPPSYQQITFGSGTIRAARFAPDGQTIVYSAAWDGTPLKLFLKHPSSPDSLPLELPSANLLSISPSGEMAIAIDCRSNHPGVCAGTLARAALTGGSPRDVADGVQEADWSPDGTSLMIVRDVGRKVAHRVPAGQDPVRNVRSHQLCAALAEGRPDRLSRPPVSPRRRRHGRGHRPGRKEDDADEQVGERGRPGLVGLGRRGLVHGHRGRREPLPVGRDGVGASARRDARSRRLEASRRGAQRARPADARKPARGRAGHARGRHARARHVLSRLLLRGRPDARTRARCSSTRRARRAARTTRSSCASPIARRSCGWARATRWRISPDGKWALSMMPIPNSPFILLPTGTGEHKQLAAGGVSPEQAATWFPDSQSIVFAGSEPGHQLRLYVQAIDGGGKPRPISPEGIVAALPGFAVSPDGKFVAAIGKDRKAMLFPVDGGEPRAIKGIEDGEFPLRFRRTGARSTSGSAETCRPK